MEENVKDIKIEENNNRLIMDKAIQKRRRNFFINLCVTIFCIMVVLVLMLSSTFLSNILIGNRKLIFYGVVLFGLLFWLLYSIVVKLYPLDYEEELYLSLSGTKHEKLFYEKINKINTLSNQELENTRNSLTSPISESSIDENSEETINKKQDKYHLSSRGKFHMVLENIGDLYSVIAIAFFIVSILFCFVLFPATVQGDCMQPLLYGQKTNFEGDKIIALKNKSFDYGDVVVFEYDYDIQSSNTSVDDGELLIKRVIATPGQVFECVNGEIYIDGEKLEEEYVRFLYSKSVNYSLDSIIKYNSNYSSIDYEGGNVVPEGYYVLLGDNRVVANDSHYFGLVREDQICGVVVIYKNENGWHKITEK